MATKAKPCQKPPQWFKDGSIKLATSYVNEDLKK